jgi:hypothetical protein
MKTLELTNDAVNLLVDLLNEKIEVLNLEHSIGYYPDEEKPLILEQIGKLQTLRNYLEAEQ